MITHSLPLQVKSECEATSGRPFKSRTGRRHAASHVDWVGGEGGGEVVALTIKTSVCMIIQEIHI
jgi:hypothetical protein